jgi:RNase P/RNase MRP subunit POP5
MMRVKVVETRVAYYDVDMRLYEKEDQNKEGVLRVERENESEDFDYMDALDANSYITFEVIEE